MSLKKIIILGSTGSIGVSSLNVVKENSNKLKIVGLVANKNWQLLIKQVQEYNPEFVVLSDENSYHSFIKNSTTKVKTYKGFESITDVLDEFESDLIINSLVGAQGLIPTIYALQKKISVAIANKETLVVAGKLVTELAQKNNIPLLPIDSEHSAIWQCIKGEEENKIKRIILTASGGPFRDTPINEFKNITVQQALSHPNWKMGPKISIDSATMFNKALEIIEAFWLYNVEPEKIEVTIHRESIIHSMVEFMDNSIKAQMGIPDMKIPIGYAIFYPNRFFVNSEPLDFTKSFNLHFEPPNFIKYPALKLAYYCLKEGGTYPAVLNAANEIAVSSFLDKKISFTDISNVVDSILNKHNPVNNYSLEEILEIDKKVRIGTKVIISKIEGKK